ncbi:MAG: hypothetical protein M3Z49_02360, partial [Bifidobacteriales bacterium]|nr:hypothetical protein [Bifidobacteriales bacterium]
MIENNKGTNIMNGSSSSIERDQVLLSVNNVDVVYETDSPVHAVQNASFELHRGEMMGLAGESGC